MQVSAKLLFQSARGPFLIASIIPVLFGASLAFKITGSFNWPVFIATLLGIVSMHAAANLTNEYYDFLNKTDVVNKNRTVFSGGSGLLVEGKMTKKQYAIYFSILYILSIACGAYLFVKLQDKGWIIVLLALVAFFLTYFYSCPPVNLAHRGLGEIVIGLCFGVLPIMGTYFVLTSRISLSSFYASIPITFLIIAVLYINQYPDIDADSFAHKRNLVVRMGPEKARFGYYLIMITTYISIALLSLTKNLPWYSAFALLTLPLALKSSLILHKKFKEPKEVFPAMGLTILNHHLTGLILIGSLIIAGTTK